MTLIKFNIDPFKTKRIDGQTYTSTLLGINRQLGIRPYTPNSP